MPGAIDKCHVDVFEVFGRRVVNYWRGIGLARCERGCGYYRTVRRLIRYSGLIR